MIDKRPARVAAMFDAIAARYDFLNHLLSAGFDRHWRTRAIRSLRLDRPRDGRRRLHRHRGRRAGRGRRDPAGAARVIGDRFLRRDAAARRREGPSAGRVALAAGRCDAGCRCPTPWRRRPPSRSASATSRRRSAALPRCTACCGPAAASRSSSSASRRRRFVRAFYLPYFRYVLPRIGRLVSGHGSAYTYLPASVDSFIPPAVMLRLLRGLRLSRARGDTADVRDRDAVHRAE